ncbi:hypothetical protein B0H67DRAFT_213060 [Lasiosphaeris hirsuta]|uniref:Uncharacterized protein n=1 Tax=Lasiosphaeris hirsuta TaxID=260670 RepID=A0AA40ASG8_9PEZI|nr:hypothetical protein B0H67DRAFT_213060 [Lasiosphaeris hirsuta]
MVPSIVVVYAMMTGRFSCLAAMHQRRAGSWWGSTPLNLGLDTLSSAGIEGRRRGGSTNGTPSSTKDILLTAVNEVVFKPVSSANKCM